MSIHPISTLAELNRAIESAWADLETFLTGVTEEMEAAHDANGWTVRDHVTHMTVWEDSVAVLFRGGCRHEALGIDEEEYERAEFHELNEIIRRRQGQQTLGEAVERLRKVHSALMEEVRSLSREDLTSTVHSFFPLAPEGDERRVIDLIHEETAAHYAEHLPWMRELLRKPT